MPMLLAFLLTALLAAVASPAHGATPAPTRRTAATATPAAEDLQRLVVLCVRQQTLPDGLTPKQRALAGRVAARLRAGQDVAAVQPDWKRLLEDSRDRKPPIDVEGLVQWVIRESYLENAKQLRAYADKVRFYNDAKREIRSHLAAMREAQRRARGTKLVTVQPRRLRRYAKDAPPLVPIAKRQMRRSELEDYIAGWEAKLNTVGDDVQMANVALQHAMQKQQQTMQMMSNVSKALHDAAMAITRNIR